MGSALPVPMVKGAAFREALLYYERKRGREYLHGLTARLDADDAALLDMDEASHRLARGRLAAEEARGRHRRARRLRLGRRRRVSRTPQVAAAV